MIAEVIHFGDCVEHEPVIDRAMVPAIALSLLVSGAYLPDVALAPRAISASGRISAPRMSAEPRGWRKRLRSGTSAVAAAALLALPRAPAQAVEISADGTTSVSRDVGPAQSGRRRRVEPAFLGFTRKRSGLDTPLDASQMRGNHIDMDSLVSPGMAKRFTERDFIFSDSLTYKGDLAEELDELDAAKEDNKNAAVVSTITTTGGALGLVYLTARGLTAIENYFKRQELKEIEAERELTGQYISVDAGDVDTSIDPLTGKNLTISKAPKAKKDNTTAAVEEPAPPTGFLGKALGFLGLGDAPEADDDDFWSRGVEPEPKPKPKPPAGSGTGPGEPSTGGDDSGDGGADSGSDGLEDDSSSLDGLDDLLS